MGITDITELKENKKYKQVPKSVLLKFCNCQCQWHQVIHARVLHRGDKVLHVRIIFLAMPLHLNFGLDYWMRYNGKKKRRKKKHISRGQSQNRCREKVLYWTEKLRFGLRKNKLFSQSALWIPMLFEYFEKFDGWRKLKLPVTSTIRMIRPAAVVTWAVEGS